MSEENKSISNIVWGVIGVFGIYYFFISGFFQPYYEKYDECKTDEECWKKVINSLIDTAVEDANDGVIDTDYYWGRKRITNAIDDLIDDNLKFEISEYFNSKLKSIPYKLRQPIMDNFGLEWN
jgi:hypothetical protein